MTDKQTQTTDREYILAMIKEDGGVPEMKAHNDRLRNIAGKLDAIEHKTVNDSGVYIP